MLNIVVAKAVSFVKYKLYYYNEVRKIYRTILNLCTTRKQIFYLVNTNMIIISN